MDWRTPSPDVPPHILKLQREEERKILLYEDPGCDGLSRASIRVMTEPESWEQELDRYEKWMDESRFDEEGRVFP